MKKVIFRVAATAYYGICVVVQLALMPIMLTIAQWEAKKTPKGEQLSESIFWTMILGLLSIGISPLALIIPHICIALLSAHYIGARESWRMFKADRAKQTRELSKSRQWKHACAWLSGATQYVAIDLDTGDALEVEILD